MVVGAEQGVPFAGEQRAAVNPQAQDLVLV
jgi:hypothetical protein